jgi:hypothetical protein
VDDGDRAEHPDGSQRRIGRELARLKRGEHRDQVLEDAVRVDRRRTIAGSHHDVVVQQRQVACPWGERAERRASDNGRAFYLSG